MKKEVTTYTYTCDVCNKPIKSDLVKIKIPTSFNLGEEGTVTGTTEWHFSWWK